MDDATAAQRVDLAELAKRRTPLCVEWPTVVVVVSCWSTFVALLVWHDHLPAVVVVALFALAGGWYMSVQHEVLHGHPTPWHRLNVALAIVPLSLWLPFPVYRNSHLLHHSSDLTEPGLDPESFYVDQATWDSASGWRRVLLRVNRTLVGRLLVSPAMGFVAVVTSEFVAMRTDPRVRRTWLEHVAGSAIVCGVVFGVADVPVWQYVLGYCYFGMSVTALRSFAEHLAVAEPTERSAVVLSGRFFGVLFLYNNLHHTHHALPGAAWYRLPALTDEMGAIEIARGSAGLYAGYGELIRRYAFRPFSTPVTPLARTSDLR